MVITAVACFFEAVAGSDVFKPYISGTLGNDLLVVETRQLSALKAQLAWAGLSVKDQLILQPQAQRHRRFI